MPVFRIVALSLLLFLASCQVPRPISYEEYTRDCKIAESDQTASTALFLVSVRLPDCRSGLGFTPFRTNQVYYGALGEHLGARLLSSGDWLNELKARIAAQPEKRALVYIHGYYNDASDAAVRGLAIREATGNAIPVVVLVWPSYNQKAKYFWDEANAEWSTAEANQLLAAIAALDPELKLTVIAHSMGNRLALNALRGLTQAKAPNWPPHQLILASPDVDRSVFQRELIAAGQAFGESVTVYASMKDKALDASWRAHGLPRAGDLKNQLLYSSQPGKPLPDYSALAAIPGITVVETSLLGYSPAGHSDFIATSQGAADLCRLILAPATVENGRERIGSYDRMFTLLQAPRTADKCDTRGRSTQDLLAKLKRERSAIHGI